MNIDASLSPILTRNNPGVAAIIDDVQGGADDLFAKHVNQGVLTAASI